MIEEHLCNIAKHYRAGQDSHSAETNFSAVCSFKLCSGMSQKSLSQHLRSGPETSGSLVEDFLYRL